jgi:hypothetical protein
MTGELEEVLISYLNYPAAGMFETNASIPKMATHQRANQDVSNASRSNEVGVTYSSSTSRIKDTSMSNIGAK